jgi:2-keto-4-pentenoate hydratase/2-oxohepta-3-ene-1,7-dioic acid hydratase in catechol pathway
MSADLMATSIKMQQIANVLSNAAADGKTVNPYMVLIDVATCMSTLRTICFNIDPEFKKMYDTRHQKKPGFFQNLFHKKEQVIPKQVSRGSIYYDGENNIAHIKLPAGKKIPKEILNDIFKNAGVPDDAKIEYEE